MRTSLRQLLFHTIICIFLTIGTFAQKSKAKPIIETATQHGYDRNQLRTQKTTEEKVVAELKYLKEHPQAPLTRNHEELLDYFINRSLMTNYFPFSTNDGKQSVLIHIDSLLPKHKEYVDYSIVNYKELKRGGVKELINSPFKKLYDGINAMAKIDFKDRNQSQLKEMLLLLNKLPNTKHKIVLLLEYFRLIINSNTSYSDVHKLCNNVKFFSDKISNLYDKGLAYSYIGDFAFNYRINDFAIRMFYLARESFDNSGISQKEKYNLQGTICRNIGYVFYQVELGKAMKKEFLYFTDAYENFVKSGNEDEIAVTSLHIFSIISFLWVDFLHDSKTEESTNQYDKVLETLRILLDVEEMDNESRYLFLYSIATNVAVKNKQASLNYHLQSLPFAALASNLSQVIACLENITFLYSSLGKNKLAIEYADLQIYLASQLGDKFKINNAILNKASIFYRIKNYDSAIAYVNNVLFDTALKSTLYPFFYNELRERAFEIKYETLDSLKGSKDSAWRYEKDYREYKTEHLQDLVDLVEVESKSITNWLERAKNKKIESEENLRLSALQNEVLAKNIARLAVNKSAQDSIAKENSDFIAILNSKIATTARDSTKNALYFAANENTLRRSVETINWRLKLGASVLIVALASTVILYLLYRKKSKELLVSSISDLRFRSAIKNHNLGNHYSKIKVMLLEKREEEAINYCERNSEYFDQFYMSLLKDNVTLSKEIETFDIFIKSEKIYKRLDISVKYLYNNINPDATIFLTDILAPLYENVLLKGYNKDRTDYLFQIEVSRSGSLLTVMVEDNGEGVDNIESLIRPGGFLDMLPNRIINYFKLKKMPVVENDVFSINSQKGIGTKITLKIPYETI